MYDFISWMLLFVSLKVSSWSSDWWNCLSWVDLDCRHPMVVSILVLAVRGLLPFKAFEAAWINDHLLANLWSYYFLMPGHWILWIFLCPLRLFVYSLHQFSLHLLHGPLIFWPRFVCAVAVFSYWILKMNLLMPDEVQLLLI